MHMESNNNNNITFNDAIRTTAQMVDASSLDDIMGGVAFATVATAHKGVILGNEKAAGLLASQAMHEALTRNAAKLGQ